MKRTSALRRGLRRARRYKETKRKDGEDQPDANGTSAVKHVVLESTDHSPLVQTVARRSGLLQLLPCSTKLASAYRSLLEANKKHPGSGLISFSPPAHFDRIFFSTDPGLAMSDTLPTKYGMFREHTYLGTGGAPPSKQKGDPVAATGRDGGLNFKATVGRQGKIDFLHEGDIIDAKTRELQEKMESRKKNVTEAPFKMASPMKKSTTAGDFIGTLEGKVKNMPAYMGKKNMKGDFPDKPRGVYTSPAKKGTFGMNKTTISERVAGHKGVATEYEFQHNPEEVLIQQRRDAQQADRKARVTDLPFKPSNPPKRGGAGVPNTTISKGKGVAGEWEYLTPHDPTPKPPPAAVENPFKPSNQHVGGRTNHIEYIHDPEEPKMEKTAARKKAESAKLASTGAWKPNMNKKSDFCRSIVRMNI
eukprot:gene19100-25704_t